ncbi:hypothetical protein [Candidatus Pantoea formicae]|uniref:hypothetical protein n=1 Tax=Candidatus Pantoea formicae TaxID=2608355 RepID=UPI003ED97BF8
MTEREVFEAYGQMLGWLLAKDSNGDYDDQRVNDFWTGWKARADVQRFADQEAETRRLLFVGKQVPDPFTSALAFGETLANGRSVYKRQEGE